ncbi:MAG: hypothetical protein ACK5CO_02660, partial [Bacteroidota bacterium]
EKIEKSKKRIDHRHHALDALVVACSSRNHVNYLNNENAAASKKEVRRDLAYKLKRQEIIEIPDHQKPGSYKKINVSKEFLKPWATLPQDALQALEKVSTTFKTNQRIFSQGRNYYSRWMKNENTGNFEKTTVAQTKGELLSLKKSLHKDTVHGIKPVYEEKMVSGKEAWRMRYYIKEKAIRRMFLSWEKEGLDEKKVMERIKKEGLNPKLLVFAPTDVIKQGDMMVIGRKAIDHKFDMAFIENKVANSYDKKILKTHLAKPEYKNKPELAFSEEGLQILNDTLAKGQLNYFGEGAHLRPRKPMYKVGIYETLGAKFPLGTRGSKSKKFVENDKGGLIYFVIRRDEHGKRNYMPISLTDILRDKTILTVVDELNRVNQKDAFVLSPTDLVYMPLTDEILKFVSFSKKQAYFIPVNVAKAVYHGFEYGALNKIEMVDSSDLGRVSIKEHCFKIHLNRLGIQSRE